MEGRSEAYGTSYPGSGGGCCSSEFHVSTKYNDVVNKQAVCVTACGNFGLAGSSTGEIRMWNMQSGKERRSFSLTGPPPGDSKPKIIAAANGKGKAKAKKLLAEKSIQAITGLATDTLNNVVVASTLEGKLYVSCFLPAPGDRS
jgi:hypothetical protein